MSFSKKLKVKKTIAIVMAFMMVCSIIPTVLFSVNAEDKTTASGVVTSVGQWEDGKRTTTWDFTKYSGTDNVTLNKDDVVGGIKVIKGTAYIKKAGAGLSAQKKDKDAVIGIPVDTATTSIELSIAFSSNNSDRYIVVGNPDGDNKVISLNTAGLSQFPDAVSIANDKTVTVTVPGSAIVDGYLLLTPGTVKAGDSGESKIATMKVVETKPNEATTTWNFRGGQTGAYDQSINGTTGTWNNLGIDGTAGKVVARTGNGDTQINAGGKITIPVPGKSEWKLEITGYKGGKWTVGETTVSEATGTGDWPVYTITGTTSETVTSIDLVCSSSSYLKEIKLTTKESTYQEPVRPEVPGNGKADIVDFGAEVFEGANNLFTKEIANAAHSGTPGAAGQCVNDFTVNDTDGNPFVVFCAGGKTNNRLRTTNTELSRYDEKSKTDEDGKTHTGYLYSNNYSASAPDLVYLNITLTANDKLTMWLGSNGNAATYKLVAPSGTVIDIDFANLHQVEKKVVYAPETGTYKLYCSNEKLVVSRIIREHSTPVEVTGATTYEDPNNYGVAAPKGFKLAFACKETGGTQVVDLKSDGTYKAYLYDGFNYKVSLVDANGYIISTNTDIVVVGVDGKFTYDCAINPVNLVKITGTYEGISSEAIEAMNIAFKADKIYVPELTKDAANKTFTLVVEKGVEYAVEVANINDYTLKTLKVKADANTTGKLEFELKPVYDVTVTLEDIPAAVAAGVTYVFTNINEEHTDKDATPYTYTFKATDTMKLRDGQYQVKVLGLNKLPLEQMYTKDVKINGAAGSTSVKFKALTTWDFSTVWNFAVDVQKDSENGWAAGIKTSLANVMNNKNSYLLVNKGGVFEVPVKKGDVVTFTYCYKAAFKVGETVVGSNSGSTTKFESTSVVADADGVMVVEGVELTDVLDNKGNPSTVNQTYFTKISVNTPTEYQAVVKVGANKQFTTINDALDFISTMNRPNGERVTVEIDPGTYDEMLVIDMPNVTLKNASATPSIELTNKGVDADENAVRITSYYGHGYTYYSMGPDCKYDSWLLEVNKHNGYPLFKNPGTGTTSGSYWNATVVVYAGGFNADGIIFENAFNQYVSQLAADDVIVPQSGAKGENKGARNDMEAGSVAVQNKAYVERAAALAVANGVEKTYFNNCKFVGRQDTLYGGENSTMSFNKCSIYGGTDYIFGGMNAVFNECDLVFNTMEDSNDVGYITAAQTKSGNGMLFYNCNVKSTLPGVDTASTKLSKPGYFGRPWQANTGMAVFVNTTIGATFDENGNAVSLINGAGWLSTLGGESANSMEYNTTEIAGADNSDKRVSWATKLTEAKLPDGTEINVKTWLSGWDGTPGAGVVTGPENPGTPENPGAVTGDATPVATYAGLALISMIMFATLFFFEKKRKYVG